MKTHLIFPILSVFVLALSLCASPVFSDQIQIHITGIDFQYDGTDIFDGTAKDGGNFNTAEADPLTTIDFFKNNVYMGRLTADDNIFADLLIDAVNNIPIGGGMLTSGDGTAGFGLDLLQNTDTQTIPLLSLKLNQLIVSYGSVGSYIAFGGMADSVVTQNLPLGLAIGGNDHVSLSFSSSNLTSVANNGYYLSHFEAFGTGNINSSQYSASFPEPSTTAALVSLAAAGLLAFFVRRPRKDY